MTDTKKSFKFNEKFDKMTVEKLSTLSEEEYEAYRVYCLKKRKFLESQKK